MADDNKPETGTEEKPETGKTEDNKTDDLAAMKAALKKANKEAETARLKLKEIEDKDKSEVDKLREERDAAVKDRDEAKLQVTRLEVATSKGLTPAQAKRLVGATQEELEADADEFLSSIKPSDDKGTPPGKPKERLSGGGDPTEEPEPDMRKLVAEIPRGF